MRKFTNEQKLQIIAEVKEAKKRGVSVTETLKKHSINHSNYYYWVAELGGKKPANTQKKAPKTQYVSLPIQDAQPSGGHIALIIGSPDDVVNAYRNISASMAR